MFLNLIVTDFFNAVSPKGRHIKFIINKKMTVECSFSHDGDEETGDWLLPMAKEVICGS
jgi:hypothetical protein